MALWGGRFESGPDALFTALNDSLPFDYRLALHDIAGSVGWAKAIHRAGVLTSDEMTRILAALDQLRAEVNANPRAPLATPDPPHNAPHDEDIHSWVERRLIEKVGPLGKKLHTGRSRNDQVATDLRLWTRDEIDAIQALITDCRAALIELCEREPRTVISGYTHLQRAQPVLLAHWALAYVEMLERDQARFRDARARVNLSPLGSGALAGTGYKVDRVQLAHDLGFEAPTRNSLDAVSDRDFVVETLAACAVTAVHLSRLGEDLILYGSQEFAFFEYSDAVTSGSSLMPQKKNPDAAELLRGKSGRILGDLVALLTTLKGLPLAYNKDLQEDKEPLLDATHHLSLCLRVAPVIIRGLKVRADNCLAAAKGGYSNATDLADYLVAKGVPFREAHDLVGVCVRRAIALNLALDDMPLAELKAIAPQCDADVFTRISIEAGLASREVLGGTGPNVVLAAIKAARDRLAT